MLSLVDLVAAGTVDLDLAAYLAAVMRKGASLLVGAQPGGAGKTAVMCALLNFLPDDVDIQPVTPSLLTANGRMTRHRVCYLAHEIGPGTYFGYVWGDSARRFFQYAHEGHLLASNLHADTLGQMRSQLCIDNRVDRATVDGITLKVFLRTARGGDWSMERWVSHVYESDGVEDHLVWRGRGIHLFEQRSDSARVTPTDTASYRGLLSKMLDQHVFTIEEVRLMLLAQRRENAFERI